MQQIQEAALHAHLSLFEETNLEKAKNSDERFSNSENVGLLDGIPLAIKRQYQYKK